MDGPVVHLGPRAQAPKGPRPFKALSPDPLSAHLGPFMGLGPEGNSVFPGWPLLGTARLETRIKFESFRKRGTNGLDTLHNTAGTARLTCKHGTARMIQALRMGTALLARHGLAMEHGMSRHGTARQGTALSGRRKD